MHCETSSGVINKVEDVAKLVRKLQPNANVFVDAMSSFGAIPLDFSNVDFLVSSANKCLEGVPGFGYALCRKERLNLCKGTDYKKIIKPIKYLYIVITFNKCFGLSYCLYVMTYLCIQVTVEV